jgi:outer membrane protein assembly factor BamB
MGAIRTCVVILWGAGWCWAQPAITLSPKAGPPTTWISVSGSGFAPNIAVDIYFGTKDEALASTDGSGNFSKIVIKALGSARPGKHWVTGVARPTGTSAQAPFLVGTNWSEAGFLPSHGSFNPYENVLSEKTVVGTGLRWSYTTGSFVFSSPAVANGVVYVGSYDGNVYALNASTGALLWSFPTGNAVDSSPAVANGVVYIGSGDNNVYALNASTGALLWSFPTGSSVESSPAVANGVVYVGSDDNNVYALNASTGAKLWSYTTFGVVFSSPAVANGVVYVGSDDKNVYALNASTGAKLWSYTTGSFVFSSPAVANGVVYVGSYDGNVYALNASTGALLWSFPTGNAVDSSPAVANGVVYIGSGDNNVYAFGRTGAAGTEEMSEPPAASSLKPDFSLRPSQATGGGQD